MNRIVGSIASLAEHVITVVTNADLYRPEACPHCHRAGPGWREVAGTGTVYTYTVVRHPTHVALADAIPYVIAIVELTEGPRVVTGITGCDVGDVRAAMPVRVTFLEVAADVTLPYFEPAP